MAKKQTLDRSLVAFTPDEMVDEVATTFVHYLKLNKRPPAHFLSGPPGCGKTTSTYAIAARVKELAKVDEVVCIPIMTSCVDPVDLQGLPMDVGNGAYFRYLLPEWAYKCVMADGPPTILFFDDLPTAHPQSQNMLFKLVHEGQVGMSTFRKNVLIMAAGNRVEDNAGAHEIGTALATRFRRIEVLPEANAFLEYGFNNGFHPLMLAYLRVHKDRIFAFDPASADAAQPLPRTWEEVSKYLFERRIGVSNVQAVEENTSLFRGIAGIVGMGTALEFDAFMLNARSAIDPELIVRNPHKAPMPLKTEMDAVYATLSGLEAHVRESIRDWKPALEYVLRKDMPYKDPAIVFVAQLGKLFRKKVSATDFAKFMTDDLMIKCQTDNAELFKVLHTAK